MECFGNISFQGSDTFLWKINDFFRLIHNKKMNEIICYIQFHYRNCNFHMDILKRGPPFGKKSLKEWICLDVCSLTPNTQVNILRCGIRKEEGYLYFSYGGKGTCNSDVYFIPEAEFFGKRSEFAPAGHITFVIQFDSGNKPSPIRTLTTNSEQLLTSNKHLSEPETENSDFDILSQQFRDLYVSGKESDMAFQVGDRKFQVHKLILGTRSSVFAAMIHHDVKEDGKTVDVIDCEADDFHEFMLYLYSGRVEKLSTDNAVGLYTLADKYMVDGLKSKCIDYLKKNMNVDIFCSAADLAVRHEETELLKYLKGYFTKNAKKIISSPYWNSFMKENTTLGSELILLVVPDYD